MTCCMLFKKGKMLAICVRHIYKLTYTKFCKPSYKSCSFTGPRYLPFVHQPQCNGRNLSQNTLQRKQTVLVIGYAQLLTN